MEDNRKFEIEVLTRLTKIETLLEDFKGVETKANEAYALSKDNKDEIEKIKENNAWAFRTALGAIIVAFVNIVMSIIRG